MEKWRKCTLGELITIKHGYAFLGEYFSDTGSYIVVTPGNFNDEGGFKSKGAKEKWYSGPIPKDYVLQKNDLIIAMTEQAEGLLGSSAIVPIENLYLHNQRIGLVQFRDISKSDSRFFYYLFNFVPVRQQIRASASGTKIRHTAPSRIYDVQIPLPPLPIQRRIAGILSAYDDLIENNQRRIAILETMARSLYREWFVHYRYPGHEAVPLVDSPLGPIPQGWEVRAVADSFEIYGGGTPSRKESSFWDGGTIQWYSPSDLTAAKTMFMDDSSDHITETGLSQSSARLIPARSILFTSRATIGAIAINTHPACTNQGFISCIPNQSVPIYFLYHWLKENVPTFERMASGATFKEISRGVFKTIPFLHPSANLIGLFESFINPIGEQLLTLQRQTQNLRRTRDLLLPRLLSGQIDVGDVE